MQRRIDLVKAMYGDQNATANSFALAKTATGQSWQRLDLAPFANRALVKEGGSWIGIPNPYIQPGNIVSLACRFRY
jgi:hypothetical protein